MQIRNPSRIVVWSGGDEQRFLEWNGTEWQVFESYTYGHYFEHCKLTENDIGALIDYFGIAKDQMSTRDVLVNSPERLRLAGNDC